MSVHRTLASLAFAVVTATGCASTSGTAASGAPPTFPPTGIAVMIGTSPAATTKTADVFDTTAHALLGRFSAAAPGAHTQIGPVVPALDGQHIFVTAYDTVDSARTTAGLYELDLATSSARYVRSLGAGIPVDATLANKILLQVIMSDSTISDPRASTRVVTVDTVTNTIETARNPLPPGPDGRVPAPIGIAFDPGQGQGQGLTYLTDSSGAIYAFFPNSLRYYRKLPGVTPLFAANGSSVALDARHGMLYQLGIYSGVDEQQHHVTSGALLATSIANGATRLSTFPYVPVAGALLDRSGEAIYFGSTFAPTPDKLYVSRVDVANAHFISRPIVYGRPEFLITGKLAFSNDGARLLMPVETGADTSLAGAMLEFDPGNLHLENSADSPDAFESGGVVAL